MIGQSDIVRRLMNPSCRHTEKLPRSKRAWTHQSVCLYFGPTNMFVFTLKISVQKATPYLLQLL
jgi:hypothetical protein